MGVEFGRTEWGQSWVRACALPGGARTSRGRAYAQQGAVLEMKVSPGQIVARVRGSRARPYRVRITAEPLPGEVLDRALLRSGLDPARLRGPDARRACRHLLQTVGNALFPSDGEPSIDCSCPDWGAPCKHGAAVALAFARAVDEDPMCWLAFRFAGQEPMTVGRPSPGRGRGPAPQLAVPPPPPAGPTAADFWGTEPAAAAPAFWASELTAAAPAPDAPGRAEAAPQAGVLSRIAPPAAWRADDPDLTEIVRQLGAALGRVDQGWDIEAAIAAAFTEAVRPEGDADRGGRARPARTPAGGGSRRTGAARRAPAVGTDRAAGEVQATPRGPAAGKQRATGGARPARRAPSAGSGGAVPAAAACTDCGTPLAGGWRYCPRCGRRLGTAR